MRRGCAGQWCDGNCFILACVLRHYCVRRTLTRLQCISSPPFSPLFISPMVPSPSLSGPFTCLASALVIGDFPCLGPSLGGAIRSSQRFCPIIPASSTLSPISVPAVLQHWRLPQTAISEHWISCLCSSLSKTCFQYRAYRTAHSHESKRLIYLLPQFSACMADDKVDQLEKCRICEARSAPADDDGCIGKVGSARFIKRPSSSPKLCAVSQLDLQERSCDEMSQPGCTRKTAAGCGS